MTSKTKRELAMTASHACLYRYRRMREAGRAFKPTAASGNMPFEGHRTCAEVEEERKATRYKPEDFGYAG